MKAEWTRKKLCEIAELNPKEFLPKGTVAKKVPMDKLRPFCREIPGFEMSAYSGGAKFRNGDTIMARITPCLENGKTAKVNILSEGEVGFGSTEYIVFRAKPGVADADFLYYLVCSPTVREPAIQSMVGSSGRQRVQNGVLEQLEVLLPPLEVQRAIGAVLRALDDKIALNTQINDNLTQQAQAIFKAKISNNPSLDLMEQKPLSDLCTIVTKGTTPTTLGRTFVAQGINFIKAESILDNHLFDISRFAFIDTDTNQVLKRSILQSGDILFTIAGTLGRFALVDDDILPANTNQAVAIIRADKKKVTPEYLYTFFLGNWQNDYYVKRVQQAVQANLSLGTIKSLPIPILPQNAMGEYIQLITPLISCVKANESENIRLQELRDALLPRLMSGELECE